MGKKFVPGMWLLMFQVFVAITLEHKEKLDSMKWQTERMRRSWNLAWVNIRSLSMQLDSFIKNFDRSQGKDYPIENDTESNEHHQDIAETLAYDCMKLLLSSPNPGALVRLMDLFNSSGCNLQMITIAEAYVNGEVKIEIDNPTDELPIPSISDADISGLRWAKWVATDKCGDIYAYPDGLIVKYSEDWGSERKIRYELLTIEQARSLCGRVPKWTDTEPTPVKR